LTLYIVIVWGTSCAQDESTSEHNNEKTGTSLKYSADFHLIEPEDKSKAAISIGNLPGNILNLA
jgi:hypothetical protein